MSKTTPGPSQKKATLESNPFLFKVCQTFLLGPWIPYIFCLPPCPRRQSSSRAVLPSSRLRVPSAGCPSREGWALFSGGARHAGLAPGPQACTLSMDSDAQTISSLVSAPRWPGPFPRDRSSCSSSRGAGLFPFWHLG